MKLKKLNRYLVILITLNSLFRTIVNSALTGLVFIVLLVILLT